MVLWSKLIKHLNSYGNKFDLQQGVNIRILIRDLSLSKFYDDHHLLDLSENHFINDWWCSIWVLLQDLKFPF